jgi:hypothetical protein
MLLYLGVCELMKGMGVEDYDPLLHRIVGINWSETFQYKVPFVSRMQFLCLDSV